MADSQKKVFSLAENPLCGIGTYKDTLNLATGDCTRQIKKLVLDGTEDWVRQSLNNYGIANFQLSMPDRLTGTDTIGFVTHFERQTTSISVTQSMGYYIGGGAAKLLYLRCDSTIGTDKTDFTAWLAAQYANGTPVTVYYVLAEPTTETVTVPTGLSGTEEGYLAQSETPTPTNPVYPTANEVLIWQHSLKKFDGANWINADVKEYDGTDWQ